MQKYDVKKDEKNRCFIIRGDFCAGALPVDIPETDPDRLKLISLDLHIHDFEKSLSYLRCVSADKPEVINEALFISGLNFFIKCFKGNVARIKISKEEFCSSDEQVKRDFFYYEAIRDKHYMHDENTMLEAFAFLIVNPESEQERLGPASVVYNFTQLDYFTEADRLRHLVIRALQYVSEQFEEISKHINERYKNLSHNDLMAFGPPRARISNLGGISINRLKIKPEDTLPPGKAL